MNFDQWWAENGREPGTPGYESAVSLARAAWEQSMDGLYQTFKARLLRELLVDVPLSSHYGLLVDRSSISESALRRSPVPKFEAWWQERIKMTEMLTYGSEYQLAKEVWEAATRHA